MLTADLAHFSPRQPAMTHLWEAKARRRNHTDDSLRATPRATPSNRSWIERARITRNPRAVALTRGIIKAGVVKCKNYPYLWYLGNPWSRKPIDFTGLTTMLDYSKWHHHCVDTSTTITLWDLGYQKACFNRETKCWKVNFIRGNRKGQHPFSECQRFWNPYYSFKWSCRQKPLIALSF